MFAIQNTGANWTNRGDADVEDWTIGDFLKDTKWHDLDLTTVMPKGATLVMIKIKASHTNPPVTILFRTKGVDNYNAVHYRAVPAASLVAFYDDLILQPDSNGFIEYQVCDADTWP
ncbi:unnamed protein product, partial [marine sediment metagenome]